MPNAAMTANASSTRVRQMATAALIAGLMAGTAWISIPLGPVPFTLQTAFVILAALLLSPGWAAASMAIYVLLGAVGLPVFAGFSGGLGAVIGPTGGFIVGFIPAAFLGSLVFDALRKAGVSWIGAAVFCAIVAEVTLYAVGLPWLMASAGLSLGEAATAAMLPFLVPDALKAGIAIAVASGVRRALGR